MSAIMSHLAELGGFRGYEKVSEYVGNKSVGSEITAAEGYPRGICCPFWRKRTGNSSWLVMGGIGTQ